MNDKPFCLWPWFHQKINPSGVVVPCCMWNDDPDNQLNSYDHKNYINSKFMDDLRESFRNQIPHKKCSTCVYEDSTSANSMRMKSFKTAKLLGISIDKIEANNEYKIISEEVAISTLCNLKCRMCSQYNSSKWIADEIALGRKPIGLLQSNWSLSDHQVDTIVRIKFHGGEPLLHQDIICKELTKIKDANRLHLLDLYITTNTTVELTNELIDLITHTKKTIINCSIDAFGKLNDYIRSDSNWDEINHNIKVLLDISNSVNANTQFIFNIDSVYNVFNAHCYNEILDWGMQYTQFIFPILQITPTLQNARNLPDDYKNEIIEKYENCINHTQDYIDRFAKIKSYKFRPKNFKYFAAEYSALINHLKNPPIIQLNEWKQLLKHHNDLLDQRRHIKLIDYNSRLAAIINEP